jgi:hypothetical protein
VYIEYVNLVLYYAVVQGIIPSRVGVFNFFLGLKLGGEMRRLLGFCSKIYLG